ncbi:Fic family protein [Corynebacterium comes]|nr:Fic family protein [Corynebacterium comes]
MIAWPHVSHESLPWASSAPLSVRARAKQPTEYESSLVPGIAEAPPTLHPDTLAAVDRATIAVTRFDAAQAASTLPLTPLLLRGESAASSRIEQLTSSARRILEAELLDTDGTGNAALIVAATAQMSAAITSNDPPGEAAVLHMHRLLLQGSQPEIAGRYREEAVWIGGSDAHPVDSLFTAPHHRHLPVLMADLQSWMRRRDVPALVLAAIAHAQFETIHPFVDGNGRTGRALIHTLLRHRGLTVNGTLPLSAGILRSPDSYFDALTSYRAGNIDPIVRLIADAALRATELGTWLGREIAEIRGSWNEQVTARRDATDWRVLDVLIRQPLVDVPGLAAELNVSTANTGKALERLEANGIVLSAQVARNRRAWRAPEILELLDEFAEKAGRREVPRVEAEPPSR